MEVLLRSCTGWGGTRKLLVAGALFIATQEIVAQADTTRKQLLFDVSGITAGHAS
jgi:hypothetical protein